MARRESRCIAVDAGQGENNPFLRPGSPCRGGTALLRPSRAPEVAQGAYHFGEFIPRKPNR
jgi:hypothetical protein